MKDIGKKTGLLTLTKVLTMTIHMLNAMFLSRFRSLEEFGTFSQLSMTVTLFSSIVMMGLPGSINYFLAKDLTDNDKSSFLSNYYTISTLLSVFAGVLLFFGTPLIAGYFNNIEIYSFTYYLLLMPWISIIGGSVGNLLIVFNRIRLLIIYNIVTSLSLLMVLIASVYLNLKFVEYIYFLIVIQVFFTLCIYIVVAKIGNGLYFKLTKSTLVSIMKFSVPLGLATIIGTIHIQLDKLIIGYYFSTQSMAIYTNAAREMPITLIASSLTAVLMPQLVHLVNKGRVKDAVQIWGNTTIVSYIFICFFSTILIVFAPEIINILYSEKYLPGVQVFRIYSVVSLFGVTYFGMVLNAFGMTKLIFYSSVASLFVNIGFNYIFYLIFGFIGPALATLLATCLVALFQLLATSKYTNLSFINIFPWKEIFRISFINLLLGTIFYLIKLIFNQSRQLVSFYVIIFIGILWGLFYSLIMLKYSRKVWSTISTEKLEDKS